MIYDERGAAVRERIDIAAQQVRLSMSRLSCDAMDQASDAQLQDDMDKIQAALIEYTTQCVALKMSQQREGKVPR